MGGLLALLTGGLMLAWLARLGFLAPDCAGWILRRRRHPGGGLQLPDMLGVASVGGGAVPRFAR
jgi:hypothetical protein